MSTVIDQANEALAGTAAAYQRAAELGDAAAMRAARDEAIALMIDPIANAARRLMDEVHEELDDIVSAGLMVFCEKAEHYLGRYDGTRAGTGGFSGYVTMRGGTWWFETRRALHRADRQGLKESEQQMVRLYYKTCDEFRLRERRSPTWEEAQEAIRDYAVGKKRSYYLDKHPELSEADLDKKVRRRISQDGHRKALENVREIVLADASAKTLSADALLGDGGVDGWNLIPDTPAQDDEPDLVEDWVRVAVLGMDGRSRKKAAAALTGVALEDDAADATVLAAARANLTNPVAQFVVLAGVEAQFDQDSVVPLRQADERALLLAAAV